MYAKLLKWCHDSEVIILARAQVLLGGLVMFADIAFGVISHTDLSPFISNAKTLAAVGIANGVVTELLRKHRATDLDVTDK